MIVPWSQRVYAYALHYVQTSGWADIPGIDIVHYKAGLQAVQIVCDSLISRPYNIAHWKAGGPGKQIHVCDV